MLTEAEIKQFIDDDKMSEKKKLAKVGLRYYEGEHDILDYRMFYYNADGVLTEDKARSNSRICHPFFTELVDQLAAYMLSFEENPIQAKEHAEGLQDYLDMYFDDEFWAEIQEVITGANAKGFEYLYAYKNAEDRLAFECADSMGVVEVRAKDTDDHCAYMIYWYIDRIDKGKKTVKRILVYDPQQVHYFVQVDNGDIVLDENEPINPRPHVVSEDKKGKLRGAGLGYIPFWRLDNCRKQFSGLKPIKGLIDDYDLMECGLSNNLQDFDTPIHLVKGFNGDDLDELQQNIKTKKVLGVDSDGGLEVLTVDIPYQARKTKADEDEKNIYRFGFGLNTAGLKDTSATTNIAIKASYTLLELKAGKLEKRLKRFLRDVLRVVLDEINAVNGTDYRPSDVTIQFERNIMTNEAENAQVDKTKAETKQLEIDTVLNLAATLDEETIIQRICDIMDIEYDDIKNKLPQNNTVEGDLTQAQNTLNDVVTDEPPIE